MCREFLALMQPSPDGVYGDATVGGGGHTAALLERLGEGGRIIGLDRDADALEAAGRRLGPDQRLQLFHRDYRELRQVLAEAGAGPLDGVLADLGISSLQLDGIGRGFAFSRDEDLDMRMDRSRGITAADWLAAQDVSSLRRVLREYGDETRHAGRIARALVRRRDQVGPLKTTGELAATVRETVPVRGPRRIDPATKTFQAIRIAVNDELSGLDRFVEDAVEALAPGGTLTVISFHSLEDRPVKRTLRQLAGECICPPGLPVCGCGRVQRVELLTRRPRRPGPEEIQRNPRARSARLRAARRLEEDR